MVKNGLKFKDVEDILQVQPFASRQSLSLRERGTSEILQGGCRQRAYAQDYRRDTVVWVKNQSSPPPPFSPQDMDVGIEIDAISESLNQRHHSRHQLISWLSMNTN